MTDKDSIGVLGVAVFFIAYLLFVVLY